MHLLGFLEFCLFPLYLAYWLTKCPVCCFYNFLSFLRKPYVLRFDPEYHPLISFSYASEHSNYSVPASLRYLRPPIRVLCHIALSVAQGLTCSQSLPFSSFCSSYRFCLTFQSLIFPRSLISVISTDLHFLASRFRVLHSLRFLLGFRLALPFSLLSTNSVLARRL